MKLAVRVVLRLSSWLIPRGRRAEWIEEWQSELWALTNQRDARDAPRAVTSVEVLSFVAGAPRHALLECLDGCTLADLSLDVREAVCRLRRAPGFAAAAVFIIGLAVAANTAIFSVVNATLLRPPPGVADPDRLVQIGRGKASGAFDTLSYPAFTDLRAHAQPFTSLAASSAEQFVVDDGTPARLTSGQVVSAGYFELIGAALALGREFTLDDERSGSTVAVISHSYWRSRFDARLETLGARIVVNARPVQIVGVAPRDFVGHAVGEGRPEIWLPLGFGGSEAAVRLGSRRHSWLWVIGRLRTDVSVAQARGAMHPVFQAIEHAHPGTMGANLLVVSGLGLRPQERAEARLIVGVLMASVGLVLIIACANVAGLLVARTTARQQELAIRLALGASRFRLMRQAMAESLVIALGAGAFAMAASSWTADGVRSLLPYEIAVDFAPDWRVFVFTLAAAMATGLVIGLLPGVRAGRTDVMRAVRDDHSGPTAGRVRTALVVVQVALSFVLVAGTTVLVRSLANIERVDNAFTVERVQTVSIDLDIAGWDAARSSAFVAAVGRALRDRVGAAAVGFAHRLPVADSQSSRSVAAQPIGFSDTELPRTAVSNIVDDGFFDALEIPLLRGRRFGPSDRSGAEPVAIVSARLAHDLWGGRDPVGHQIHFGVDAARVVGVVRDVPARTLREPAAAVVYLPLAQHPTGHVTVILRGASEGPATDLVKSTVGEFAPGVPLSRVASLRDLIRGSMRDTELTATLLGLYGGVTLLLAAIGIYTLVAHATRQRTREIGIRVAVGSSPAQVQGAVVGGAVRLALIGIGLGAGVTVGVGSALDRLLLGITPSDPSSLTLIALLFAGIAAGAAWWPARQAVAVDLVTALKSD